MKAYLKLQPDVLFQRIPANFKVCVLFLLNGSKSDGLLHDQGASFEGLYTSDSLWFYTMYCHFYIFITLSKLFKPIHFI